jgi:sterol desaturase/sphingolipid hydroxylase (fatty acid hydroxylase superfamily)
MEWEAISRIGVFVAVFAVFSLAERRWPRRAGDRSSAARWWGNLAMTGLGTIAIRLALPLVAIEAALVAGEREWGILNRLELPAWLAFAVAFVALDLGIYLQHRAFHAVPWLWRLHRVHHSDLMLDASSGLRFHPFELLLSMGFKIVVVVALGAPVLAVLAFEIVLNAGALFTHSNVALPRRLDGVLRGLIVTPDMHRIHHSVHRDETDSNFGFNLSVWDRLFATYRPSPRDGHEQMELGVGRYRAAREQRFGALLLQPFGRS